MINLPGELVVGGVYKVQEEPSELAKLILDNLFNTNKADDSKKCLNITAKHLGNLVSLLLQDEESLDPMISDYPTAYYPADDEPIVDLRIFPRSAIVGEGGTFESHGEAISPKDQQCSYEYRVGSNSPYDLELRY